MKFKNFKKIVILLVLVILICALFTSCINTPLRKKMLEYYSNDANYVELTGEVIPIEEHYDKGDGNIAINITTSEHNFTSSSASGQFIFKLYTNKNILGQISIGDNIHFVSAPMYFYNGHVLPIVYIEKQGIVLLSLEEGKGNYLDWIKETFSGI